MFTEFVRDQAFAIAWLGLMSAAWFGWAQEDPRPKLRGWLGAGSILGFLLVAPFAVLVWRNWSTPTALEGRYWIFGVIVLAEVALIGGGCALLARRKLTRWTAWWVAIGVALHFLPLAWVFADWSYLALAAIQLAGLAGMFRMLSRGTYATSRWACPWMGATFLAFALISALIFLASHGYAV